VAAFSLFRKTELQSLNVLCLPALGSLDDVELDGLTFLEAAEALILNGGVVNEHIFAVLTADKTVTLGVIEPLNCSLFHCVARSFFVEFADLKRELVQAGGAW